MYEVLGKNYNDRTWVYWKTPSTIAGVIVRLIYATTRYDLIEVHVRYSPTRWRFGA